MTAQRLTTTIAGLFILLSLAFAHLMGQINLAKISWLWFTIFVGANLFQSGISQICLLTKILKMLGAK